ncbi:MAG: AEC family transporter [Clostridia bacterium]|nr:AEC family transporter [Clostridia bacterium]
MQSLIISFEVVLPLFIMLAIGYIVRLLKMVTDDVLIKINRVCFHVFLPLLLFVSIYKADISTVFNPRLLLFAFVAVLCLFAAAFFITGFFVKQRRRRSVMIQAIFRSNFVIFGVPIAISLCGEASAGIPAITSALVVPMYNVLSVFVLSLFSESTFSLKKTLLQVAKNPLVLASLFGVLMLITGVKLPELIISVADDLAAVATPLSLVVLGGLFKFSSAKKNKRALIFGVAAKLIAVPAIMLPIAAALGFRGVDLVVCLSIFASPIAIASFTMAQQMGADAELAGELVVFSAFLSIITIFVFVFILKQLALI